MALREGSTSVLIHIQEALAAWFTQRDELVERRLQRKKPRPVEGIYEMILTGDRGEAVGTDYFRHRMADAYKAIATSGGDKEKELTTHGLRYTTVVVLTELGCSDETISSITGHKTVAMVRKYQAKKRQAQLASAAMDAASEQRKTSAV